MCGGYLCTFFHERDCLVSRWISPGPVDTGARSSDASSALWTDRKSTRLNSSHRTNSYAVFCLKKKTRLLRPIPSLQLANCSYFPTLGIPLVVGRMFDETNRQRSPPAVLSASVSAHTPPMQIPL